MEGSKLDSVSRNGTSMPSAGGSLLPRTSRPLVGTIIDILCLVQRHAPLLRPNCHHKLPQCRSDAERGVHWPVLEELTTDLAPRPIAPPGTQFAQLGSQGEFRKSANYRLLKKQVSSKLDILACARLSGQSNKLRYSLTSFQFQIKSVGPSP
jgi:hypothetical protein